MAYSLFEQEYKTVINNIIKEIYGNTEYWGRGPSGNYGIVKPLTPNDDPNWSNYNFINTHYSVRDKIVIPYLKSKYGITAYQKDLSKKDSVTNAILFEKLIKDRLEIFGPHSTLKYAIVDAINKTRSSGTKRESYVKTSLQSLPGVTNIEMVATAGGTEDFMGIDMRIFSDGTILPSKSGGLTAQVKPFTGLKLVDGNYVISTESLRRKYNTDLMIFGKQKGSESHIAVFKNQPDLFVFTDSTVSIPKSLMSVLVNFNSSTNSIVYKT